MTLPRIALQTTGLYRQLGKSFKLKLEMPLLRLLRLSHSLIRDRSGIIPFVFSLLMGSYPIQE